MTDRPSPERDFRAASDRFDKALDAAAQLPTEADHMAAIDAAIGDYNRAVDAYNAHVEEYSRTHGQAGAAAEMLGYLVRDGERAALVPAADAEMKTAVHGLLADLGQRARDEKTTG